MSDLYSLVGVSILYCVVGKVLKDQAALDFKKANDELKEEIDKLNEENDELKEEIDKLKDEIENQKLKEEVRLEPFDKLKEENNELKERFRLISYQISAAERLRLEIKARLNRVYLGCILVD